MTKINVLPKQVYNQISAGEVVERPASIVKELFENSVDAGAENITVEIENGGINNITVSDDGSGIEADDVEKVFMPHATSKISSADDLCVIRTLGFRGEAMSSIAAVSKVSLVTKTANDEIGTKICVEGGEITEKSREQCEIGTTVSVSGIFFNTPGRLKFLKQPKSEESEISSLMQKLILSNPSVAVKYYVNSELIYQSYGDGLKSALIAIYSKRAVDNCLEISTEQNGIKIDGFLGGVNFVKPNRTYQTLIVNGRWVTDQTVSSAIHNAYSAYLMKRQYPFYVLNITVPADTVDVNVHPRKAEIRFENSQVIYGTVYKVVSSVIDGTSRALEIVQSKLVPQPISSSNNNSQKPAFKEEFSNNLFNGEIAAASPSQEKIEELKTEDLPFPSAVKRRQTPRYEPRNYLDEKGEVVYAPYDLTIFPSPHSSVGDHQRVNNVDYTDENYLKKLRQSMEENYSMDVDSPMKYIGQVFDTYLIFEKGKDLYIVDQHAAHERILYDKMMELIKEKKIYRQPLIVPYLIKLNPEENDMLFEVADYIRELGIDIGFNDTETCKIYAVPDELYDMDIERFFFDLITDEKLKTEKIPSVIRETVMQKACKSAIKAGDKLDKSEIDALMADVSVNLGMKCPHGRPVVIKISKREVAKWFKRIV